jgi:hypothetical protein
MVVTLKKLMAAMAADPGFAKRTAFPSAEKSADPQDEETERLFTFIGRYVVLFQDIEAKLDQIISLAISNDRSHVSNSILPYLTHAQKIDAMSAIVHSSSIADNDPFRLEWLASFEEVVQRLKAEATRRNKIVHSHYLFEFIAIGHSPIRSKRIRNQKRQGFEHEEIDSDYINQATLAVAELSFDLGMALTQFVHWRELIGRRRDIQEESRSDEKAARAKSTSRE